MSTSRADRERRRNHERPTEETLLDRNPTRLARRCLWSECSLAYANVSATHSDPGPANTRATHGNPGPANTRATHSDSGHANTGATHSDPGYANARADPRTGIHHGHLRRGHV